MSSNAETFLRFVGLDVGIDQVPHIGFVGFQVEAFAAGLTDHLPQLQIIVDSFLRRVISAGLYPAASNSSAMLA